MDFQKHFVILAILFFSLSSMVIYGAPAAAAAAPNKLVERFCGRKGTSMKKIFCLNVFNSDPRGATADNGVTLFQIAMDQGVLNVTKTRTFFLEMSKVRPNLYPTLLFCIHRYDTVLGIFKSAIDQVAGGKGDLVTMSYDVALAYDCASQCMKRLDADGIVEYSLPERTGVVMDHALVCYQTAVAVSDEPQT